MQSKTSISRIPDDIPIGRALIWLVLRTSLWFSATGRSTVRPQAGLRRRGIVEEAGSSDFVQFLKEAVSSSAGEPYRLTIRQLLARAGHHRRGPKVVRTIKEAMVKAGVTTEPPFTDGWALDSEVEIRTAPPEGAEALNELVPVGMKVALIPSSVLGVKAICPNDTIDRALSVMERHDYSQLPVLSGRATLKGAVTWQSIAQAQFRKANPTLSDVIVSYPPEAALDEELLPLVPRVMEAGFAFVRGRDGSISGIITPADLGTKFTELAGPFVVLEEIEKRLRIAVERAFDIEEMRALAIDADAVVVDSVDDLSLGTIVRFLERPDHFSKLHWRVDRHEFMDALQGVRSIRNDLVHFSPDPLDPEQVAALHGFARWLRMLECEE
jgi:predicted transcriptional regulator